MRRLKLVMRLTMIRIIYLVFKVAQLKMSSIRILTI